MVSGAVEAMTIWLGQSVPNENLGLLFTTHHSKIPKNGTRQIGLQIFDMYRVSHSEDCKVNQL